MTDENAVRLGRLKIAIEARLMRDREFRDSVDHALADYLRSRGKRSFVVDGKRLTLEEMPIIGPPSDRRRRRSLKAGAGGRIAPWEQIDRIKVRSAA